MARTRGASNLNTLADAVSRIYANTKPEGECLVTTRARDSRGYARQQFEGKAHRAHRLVARYYLGPCPERMEVRHLCGRGAEGCVTASHLRYGTRQENALDAERHRPGYHPKGEQAGRAKLTEEQVRYIRSFAPRKGLDRVLAREMGVHRNTIGSILARRAWKHI